MAMRWLVGKRNLHLADSQATLALAAGRTACIVVRNAPFRTVKRAVLQVKTCVFATCCRPAGCAGCPGLRNVFTEKATCRIGPVGGSGHRHPACRLARRARVSHSRSRPAIFMATVFDRCALQCALTVKRDSRRGGASRCGGCFTSLPGGNHNLSSCTVKWRIIGASHAMRTPLVTCSRRS